MNSRLRIEPILQESGLPSGTAIPISREGKRSQTAIPPTSNTQVEEHPLVKKLYNDFGAEKV